MTRTVLPNYNKFKLISIFKVAGGVPGAGLEPAISGFPVTKRLVPLDDYESGALARLSHPGSVEFFIERIFNSLGGEAPS